MFPGFALDYKSNIFQALQGEGNIITEGNLEISFEYRGFKDTRLKNQQVEVTVPVYTRACLPDFTTVSIL